VNTTMTDMRKRFRGCLIGGAVGDALGALVEFMGYSEIVRRFGVNGIYDMPSYGVTGAITEVSKVPKKLTVLAGHSSVIRR
jgi:ADP-ribosylglycohydrolase